ncbi:MAG: M15 family metallopeptidase [Alphaproteobacteria bacterium]|nr:M15 family metallopeptidase [Alphaproteobacteria bacterium]
MPKGFHFSQRSVRHLLTLDPELAAVARLALSLSRVDFTIISARRTRAEQRRLVAAGKSRTMRSRHLNGQALDFVPLDPTTGKGRFDRALAIEVAVAFLDAGIERNCPVRWGGSWREFEDIPHIEMRRPLKRQ